MRTPLNTREWLEDMRRFHGRDAQRATDLLADLDEIDDMRRELDDWGEKVAADPTEGQAKMSVHNRFIEMMERDDMAKEFGADDDDPVKRLDAVLAYAKRCEATVFRVQELAAAAGLVGENDHTTDPLPLLAMFLPIEPEVVLSPPLPPGRTLFERISALAQGATQK